MIETHEADERRPLEAEGREKARAEGTITTLTERHFGFIRPDNGREDVFFHESVLVGTYWGYLQEGDRVSFTAEVDPRGKRLRAANVQLIKAIPAPS